MKHIFVLDSDKSFANWLAATLQQKEGVEVTAVPAVKEACLLLLQHPQDLAFIPVSSGGNILRALRALQPDLRIILLADEPGQKIPATFSGEVQGVLIKPLAAYDLPEVLKRAEQEPFIVLEENPSPTQPQPQQTEQEAAQVSLALHTIELGEWVETAVLTDSTRLIGFNGRLTEPQAALVASKVTQKWSPGTLARLQFIHLPAQTDDLLLYTRPLEPNYLLTLAAPPEASITLLRLQSEQMIAILTDALNGRAANPKPTKPATAPLIAHRQSYAIAWRPRHPLSQAMLIPLRRVLMRLAADNDCVLTYVSVLPELVHIVVICPPGKDSIWAAYFFKNHADALIRSEFNLDESLWEPGFYACESTDPLTETELNLFMEQS